MIVIFAKIYINHVVECVGCIRDVPDSKNDVVTGARRQRALVRKEKGRDGVVAAHCAERCEVKLGAGERHA